MQLRLLSFEIWGRALTVYREHSSGRDEDELNCYGANSHFLNHATFRLIRSR